MRKIITTFLMFGMLGLVACAANKTAATTASAPAAEAKTMTFDSDALPEIAAYDEEALPALDAPATE
jgi:hypothetical protein